MIAVRTVRAGDAFTTAPAASSALAVRPMWLVRFVAADGSVSAPLTMEGTATRDDRAGLDVVELAELLRVDRGAVGVSIEAWTAAAA